MIRLLILMVLVATTSVAYAKQIEVYIKNGVLDLRNIDIDKTIVRADGEWLFVYNQFVSPDEVSLINWDTQKTYKRKAGWNKQRSGNNYPELGYGTYYLKILTSDTDSTKTLGFLLRLVKTSGRMYINGKLSDSSGNPGKTAANTTPYQKPLIGLGVGNSFEVVIHASNFSFNRAGIDESLYVGDYSLIRNKVNISIALLMFSCGALFLVGLYHGILFLFRPNNREVLIFSLFSFAIAIRMLLLVDKPYLLFFDMEADYALKLEFWTVFFAMPLLYSYYFYIFPQIFSKIISYIYICIAISICILSITITTYQYAKLIPIFELYIITTYLMILYGLIVSTYKRYRYSFMFLASFLIIFLGSLNDILFERGIIKGGFIIQYAIFIFIVCQAILIGKRFSDSENKLSDIVEEQTSKLKAAVFESEKSYSEVRMLSNSIMNLLEDERKSISRELHDDFGQSIRAAGFYADAISRNLQSVEIDKDAIRNCIANADKISSALIEVYNKNRNLLRRLRPEILDTLGLDSAIEELLDNYRRNGFHIEFICKADVEKFENKEKITIYRILQEAITNILKYAETEVFKVHLFEELNQYVFIVSDNGKGFDVTSAGGVGLISMRERMANIGGSIVVQSQPLHGTMITAKFPKKS